MSELYCVISKRKTRRCQSIAGGVLGLWIRLDFFGPRRLRISARKARVSRARSSPVLSRGFSWAPRCSKFLAQCLNVLALEEARHFCLPAQLNALEAHSRLPLAAHSRLQQTIFSKWEVMQCNIQPVYSDKDIVFCSCAGKSHQTIVSEVRTKALFGLEINFILISREEMRQQAHEVNKVPVHNELLIVDADQQPQ